jgi:uncharacterized membrane protein YGL010W
MLNDIFIVQEHFELDFRKMLVSVNKGTVIQEAHILTLLYKIFYVKLPSNEVNRRKNSFFDLIISIILYIPCIFSGLFEKS